MKVRKLAKNRIYARIGRGVVKSWRSQNEVPHVFRYAAYRYPIGIHRINTASLRKLKRFTTIRVTIRTNFWR